MVLSHPAEIYHQWIAKEWQRAERRAKRLHARMTKLHASLLPLYDYEPWITPYFDGHAQATAQLAHITAEPVPHLRDWLIEQRERRTAALRGQLSPNDDVIDVLRQAGYYSAIAAHSDFGRKQALAVVQDKLCAELMSTMEGTIPGWSNLAIYHHWAPHCTKQDIARRSLLQEIADLPNTSLPLLWYRDTQNSLGTFATISSPQEGDTEPFRLTIETDNLPVFLGSSNLVILDINERGDYEPAIVRRAITAMALYRCGMWNTELWCADDIHAEQAATALEAVDPRRYPLRPSTVTAEREGRRASNGTVFTPGSVRRRTIRPRPVDSPRTTDESPATAPADPALIVRRATLADIRTILAMRHDVHQQYGGHTDQWSSPFDPTMMEGRVRAGDVVFMIHDDATKPPIGTLSLTGHDTSGLWPLESFQTKPVLGPAGQVHHVPQSRVHAHTVISAHRGAGDGRQIFDVALQLAAERDADELRVEVWTTNTTLQGIYQQEGFDPQYFDEGDIAGALMAKSTAGAVPQVSRQATEPELEAMHKRLRVQLLGYREGRLSSLEPAWDPSIASPEWNAAMDLTTSPDWLNECIADLDHRLGLDEEELATIKWVTPTASRWEVPRRGQRTQPPQ